MRNDNTDRLFYACGKVLFFIGVVTVLLGAFGGLNWLLQLDGCVFRRVTGVYCPGCGGTRAFFALLRLEPVKSFLYHPAVIYFAVLYLVFMGKMFLLKHFEIGTEREGRLVLFILIGAGLILVQWFVKLAGQLVFHITWI
ncbi:MAG: DUF2752 domain-containing protein [Lachnospiraceae bacterium]